jgi:hypothetical protein
MGMQATNLQNLPENYAMKFCVFNATVPPVSHLVTLTLFILVDRDVSCYDVATDIIRCGRSQRTYCRIRTCKNVSCYNLGGAYFLIRGRTQRRRPD